MKKLLVSIGLIFLFLTGSTPVKAVEINKNDFDYEIVYQDEEITVGSFGNNEDFAKVLENSPTSITVSSENINQDDSNSGIVPFKTVSGPGGVVTLDSSDNKRTIYWTVKPSTAWPWIFEGNLELQYFSGYRRNVDLTGAGVLGSYTGGFVELNAHKGGTARLTGTAYDLRGDKFTVVPQAALPFLPSN